jgi:hypothetical protein
MQKMQIIKILGITHFQSSQAFGHEKVAKTIRIALHRDIIHFPSSQAYRYEKVIKILQLIKFV